MSMHPGTRLGPFEIVGALGAGGMGEVYRARDTRLGRDVAIKVLPDSVAADPQRMARFEREAQLLASLNHPGIATIHGLEESGPTRALVMELVEGPTLAERIAQGPVPLHEAISIAKQIAEALEYAHERGIIHRDLKPANVKITPEGTVKLLDFGLAKAVEIEKQPTDTSYSPTLSIAATQAGVILGSAGYMSPEQARGKPVDKRADIWAFGAVLFEMLTGERAFGGETVTDVLAAVVTREPDWSSLPAATPPGLKRLIRRCLLRDLRERLHDIADVRIGLDDSISETVPAVANVHPPRNRRILWGAIAAVAAAVGFAAGIWMKSGDPPSRATRLVLTPPVGLQRMNHPVVSKDGSFVVYLSDRLYLQRLDEFTARPLPGTEGSTGHFLSPDGRWIAFFQHGKLKRMAVSGGDALVICDGNTDTPGGAWGSDNTILFSPSWGGPLHRVPADGGVSRPVTTPDTAGGEKGHWWPDFLPDGKSALFTIWRTGSGLNDARIGVLDLESGSHRTLFPGSAPRYLSSGHILYFHAGSYHAIPFDAKSLKATGESVNMLEDIRGLDPQGSTIKHFSVSENGTLVYSSGPLHTEASLAWADRSGTIESLGFPPRAFYSAALSPEGSRVAASRLEGGLYTLWIYDIERKTEERMPIEGSNWDPVWHPDGERFAFISMRKGVFDIFVKRLDGSQPEALLARDLDESLLSWSRRNDSVVIVEWLPSGKTEIALTNPADAGERRVLVAGDFEKSGGVVSPDDRWLAYATDSSKRMEVYVQPFPGPGPAMRVSTSGGSRAFWSPRGGELFYVRGEELIAVRYRDDSGRFIVVDERPLFRSEGFWPAGITPDGARFLIVKPTATPSPPNLRVVLNWFEELRDRGAGKNAVSGRP